MRTQLIFAAFAATVISPLAFADGHGGYGGHAAPGVHHAYGPAYSAHYYGGPRGYGAYYGPRYYGHYGPHYYYGHYGYYGPHYYGYPYYYYPGWYGAVAIGTFVATLPLYYDSFWWGGVRYYSYGDTYYRWNSDVNQYEVVSPPVEAAPTTASTGTELFAYPKQGQNEAQQKNDRYECHRWAADQAGYDPTQASGPDAAKRADYMRAEAACLTGRGYSVK
jgi:hypothetical protein